VQAPLQLGKLSTRGLLNAVAPGKLVLIADQLSNRRFLVDTGAAYSIFPHFSSSSPHGPALAGPGGTPIPCWGEKQLHLSFGGKKFSWSFLLAAVQFPIIGVDFLRHFKLLVDPAGNRLVDTLTYRSFVTCQSHTASMPPVGGVSPPAPAGSSSDDSSTPSSSPPSSSPSSPSPPSSPARPYPGAAVEAAVPGYGPASPAAPLPPTPAVGSRPPSSVAALLEEYPDVVNPGKLLPARVVHDVEHHIRTAGPPIASKFRRLEGEKLEAARKEFASMEAEGIIRRSTSPWASPLHMVPKKDGSWRPCGDFRRLNLVTEPDVYPLPNMLDFADRLHGCTIFSKIDLRKGYWQIPVRPEDIKKTALATPFGLSEFLRMPFGLRNAGSSFPRMMDRVLAGLPFAYCYLDDLRIASRDQASHISHVQQVLERLREFGLVLSLKKC